MKYTLSLAQNRPAYFAFFILLTIAIVDLQASSVFTDASVAEGENSSFSYILDGTRDSSPVSSSSSSAGGATHDLSAVGGSGDLVFTGQSSAEAGYQYVRIQASGELQNTFYDPGYDNINRSGVPTSYTAVATAGFEEVLAYSGTAQNYTSIYIFRVSGQIAGSGGGSVIIDINHGSQSTETSYLRENGTYSYNLYSSAYQHGVSPQNFRLQVQAVEYFTMTPDIPAGLDLSGSISFNNTVEFLGVDLRDESGVLQPQGTITSDSGQTINIMAVPEPSTVILSLLGGMLLLWKIRQRMVSDTVTSQ